MKNKFFSGLLIFIAILFSSSTVYAAHYVLGTSSVDNGEIRWGGSTQYTNALNDGISTWNAQGAIYIAPDTYATIEDLTVSDYYDSLSMKTGYYHHNPAGADSVNFNTYELQSSSNDERQNTTTHELGHSLGLAHSYSYNIMYDQQTSQTVLGTQDLYDYDYLWGN